MMLIAPTNSKQVLYNNLKKTIEFHVCTLKWGGVVSGGNITSAIAKAAA